mgnify:CR=1 FL=1
MWRRFVDISMHLENGVASDPPGYEPKIEYLDHHQTVDNILAFFPGMKKEDLPDGQSWAYEWVRLMTHNGTHLDAPYHFHSTMNKGERAIPIDEVPLDWCFRPGVKLDFRHFEDGYVVKAKDVEAELKRIGHCLAPMEIVGRNGARLRERWRDDAHAYLGVTVPDFPNLFCLYGPNTNLVANGSIIFFTECEVNHLVDAVRLMLEHGARAIEPRAEVLDAYIETIDAQNAARVWGQADVPSWYRNAAGRVTQNWPGTLEEFWAITRTADPADYLLG